MVDLAFDPGELRGKGGKWIKDGDGKGMSDAAGNMAGVREKQLAAMDPGSRALALAQEETRLYNPKLTGPLGTPQEAGSLLQNWLARGNHPRADEAYVARHSDPHRQTSNAGRGPDGEPMVALHQDRWDYGTLAHEAAHLLDDQATGRQVNGPPPPGGIHGPSFLAHYARLLGGIAKGAGDDLLASHAEHMAAA